MSGADVPLFDVVGVEANHPYGHIALGVPGGRAQVTFCDMGPVLRVWAYASGDLTPDAARNLAAELAHWADRKQAAA